ncbi:hypothetical protein H4S06_006645, partial [Coemansia sp. BCRC 34490]
EDIPTASRTVRRSAIVNFMRKEDAKRKLLAEDTDDDFIDNDSDDGSDADEQNGSRNQNENQAGDQSADQNQSQSQKQGEGEGQRKANWKPTSANLDNLVAQLAKVLIHPDEPTDTLLDNRNNEAKEEGNDGDLDEPDIVYLGSAQASPRRAEQITTPPPQKATVFRRLEHETGSTSSIVDAYSRGSTATLDGADTRIHSMTIRLSANSAASNPASNPGTTSAESTSNRSSIIAANKGIASSTHARTATTSVKCVADTVADAASVTRPDTGFDRTTAATAAAAASVATTAS